MKIVNPEIEVWGECPTDPVEAYKWIERAGRVCYRSEDNIVQGSDKVFVENLIKRGHWSVIEHSNFVVRTKNRTCSIDILERMQNKYYSPFLRFEIHEGRAYIGGNFRAWMEMFNISDISTIEKFFSDDDCNVEIVRNKDDIPRSLKMVTVSFLTDRAVTHEMVRHRPAGYSQESQRYCSYKQHLEVTLPTWFGDIPKTKDPVSMSMYKMWTQSVEYAEKAYKYLLRTEPNENKKAERARIVLPNQTSTRIVMTATVKEWEHVFKLRCPVRAYSEIRALMLQVRDFFKNNSWV